MNIEDVKIDRRTTAAGKYERNPFLVETIATAEIGQKNIYFGVDGSLDITDRSTGEQVTAHAAFKQVRVVDKTKFVKLFVAMRNVFFDFTKSAQKLLQVVYYLISHEAINRDVIYLNYEVVLEYCTESGIKLGKSSYYTAMNELITKKILAQSTKQNLYYINPTMMFNGNRATFIQEIITLDPTLIDDANKLKAEIALENIKQLSNTDYARVAHGLAKN